MILIWWVKRGRERERAACQVPLRSDAPAYIGRGQMHKPLDEVVWLLPGWKLSPDPQPSLSHEQSHKKHFLWAVSLNTENCPVSKSFLKLLDADWDHHQNRISSSLCHENMPLRFHQHLFCLVLQLTFC